MNQPCGLDLQVLLSSWSFVSSKCAILKDQDSELPTSASINGWFCFFRLILHRPAPLPRSLKRSKALYRTPKKTFYKSFQHFFQKFRYSASHHPSSDSRIFNNSSSICSSSLIQHIIQALVHSFKQSSSGHHPVTAAMSCPL